MKVRVSSTGEGGGGGGTGGKLEIDYIITSIG